MTVNELITKLQELSQDKEYYVSVINGANGQMPLVKVTIEDDYWYGDNRQVIVLSS